jgi:O-methyltransferase
MTCVCEKNWEGADCSYPKNFIFQNLERSKMARPNVFEGHSTLARRAFDARIPGDVVEIGTYKGGSAANFAHVIKSTAKHLWLFDSFKGHPRVDPELNGPLGVSLEGKIVGTLETVKRALKSVGAKMNRVTFVEGFYNVTFKNSKLPKAISILHIDCDWYEWILESLRVFYPLVPIGGVIILDDFYYYPFSRAAVYEFFAEANISPMLEGFGNSQAFWIKGRGENPSGGDGLPLFSQMKAM